MSTIEHSAGNGPESLTEERGVPPVNSRKRGGKAGKVVGVMALVAIAGVMAWLNIRPDPEPVTKEDNGAQTRRSLPPLNFETEAPPPPAAAAEPPTLAAPPAAGIPGAPAKPSGPTEEELLLMRRQRAPILSFGNSGGNAATPAAVDGQLQGDDDIEGGLGGQLQATRTDAASAFMLTDRNYLIAKGTFLDCALITALTSTLPGMTSCRLTRNVYSDNGKVLLLERGSIIEGEYRSGQMKQGMNRIFVLWTRVRTPNGVAVKLDSPGADELGRSGLPGWVDTHFWERYGGALLLSLVDAGTEYAVAQSRSDSGGDTISLGGTGDATQDAAELALQNSINIPPTLNKNQGDLINIYVARDLDFRGVYDLRISK